MYYKLLNFNDATQLINNGIQNITISDTYANIKYYVYISDGDNSYIITLKKNDDGLTPIVYISEYFLYLGYGHCVDIFKIKNLQLIKHFDFESIIYNIIPGTYNRIIIIMELDIICLDQDNSICWTKNFNEILFDYKIDSEKLLIITKDQKLYQINIKTGKQI